MNLHYQRFPGPGKKDGLTKTITEILTLIVPEKIFLIGMSQEIRLTENIFIKNPLTIQVSDWYDLLILYNGKDKGSRVEMETRLKLRLNHRAGLNFRLMDVHEFNRAVKAGNEYENFILLNAMICYDSEKIPLEDPVMPDI
jgi:hypothetical protein